VLATLRASTSPQGGGGNVAKIENRMHESAAKAGGEEIGYFDNGASGFDSRRRRHVPWNSFPKNGCDAGFDSSKEEFALPLPRKADFACSPVPHSEMPVVKSTVTSLR
jgi:hypothetical protein